MSNCGKPTLFETLLGIKKPGCCSHGDCCKGASPSTPAKDLLLKAKEGNAFARGFFSIMEAYDSHEAARAVVGELVDRTLLAAEKSEAFTSVDEVVFYRCRYLLPDNRCGVYEDRPQFCRDYPETPFIVVPKGCAFEPWVKACKARYESLTLERERLLLLQSELLVEGNTNNQAVVLDREILLEKVSHGLRLTSLWLSSPLTSF
jgi:Fe-S-cluster containining protein